MVTGFEGKPGCGWKLLQMGLQVEVLGGEGPTMFGTTADDVTAQAVIDAWTPADSAAWVIPQVKEHANALILARYPQYKQTNMLARAAELVEAQQLAPLTVSEAEEMAALKAAWAWIKAVRTTSKSHETALLALTEYSAIAAYDWSTGWPE